MACLAFAFLPGRAYNDAATILKTNFPYGEHNRVGTLWGLEVRIQLHGGVKFTRAMAT